mmetsp:Transcript_17140/g.51229  ORF Transcript_17140/g.51229 Transcript_17140/m.51229 type:complete len:233 (-) Transcript_17140:58-756(-)
MALIGLTGGISTGKSTVSKIIRSLGIPIIDADVLAREAVEPGTNAHKLIVKEFGTKVLLDPENLNSGLNRELLGAIIFENEEKRRLLNKCVHQYVFRSMTLLLMKYLLSGHTCIVLDVPLLFETKTDRMCSATIVVDCNESTQLERLMKRDGFTEEEARKRIGAQMSTEEKKSLATYVIDNNHDLENTKAQVLALFQRRILWSRPAQLQLVYQLCLVAVLFSILFLSALLVC